jgi:hypothetical protein
MPLGNVTHPHPWPHGSVQARLPFDTESDPELFLIIAIGVLFLIFTESGDDFSSCFRDATSDVDEAVEIEIYIY